MNSYSSELTAQAVGLRLNCCDHYNVS